MSQKENNPRGPPPPVPSAPPSLGRVLALKYYKKVSKSLSKGFKRSATTSHEGRVNSKTLSEVEVSESEISEGEDSVKSSVSSGNASSSGACASSSSTTSANNPEEIIPEGSIYENIEFLDGGTLKQNCNLEEAEVVIKALEMDHQQQPEDVDLEEDDDSSKWETSITNSSENNNKSCTSTDSGSGGSCSCDSCTHHRKNSNKEAQNPLKSSAYSSTRVIVQRPGHDPPPPPPKFPSSTEESSSGDDSFASCASNPEALALLPEPVPKKMKTKSIPITSWNKVTVVTKCSKNMDDDEDPKTDAPELELDDDEICARLPHDYEDLVEAVTQTLTLTLKEKNVLVSMDPKSSRPETGPGISGSDLENSDPEPDHRYQNIFMGEKLNKNSIQGIPISSGKGNDDTTATPVVHTVINLPPRMMNMIKQRRKNNEDLTFQKASRLSRLMLAEYKAGGSDRPEFLSAPRLGRNSGENTFDNKTNSLTSERRFSKVSSNVEKVGKSVSTMKKKMGFWYHRKVKIPVEQLTSRPKSRGIFDDEIDGRSKSRCDMISSPIPSNSDAPTTDAEESDYCSVLAGDYSCSSAETGGTAPEEEVMQIASGIKQGQNEFEDLRRLVKQGGDFCKDLAAVLHERSELESQYAKGLSKLSSKLLKASKEATGSVAHAWQAVAVQIDTQAELHRQWSTALAEELARPLRNSTETQHKIRKSVEVLVEKTTRNLADWRTAEAKAKRQCFSSSKEYDKFQDSSPPAINSQNNSANNQQQSNASSINGLNNNVNNGSTEVIRSRSRLLSVPPLDNKDPIKLEAKRRKAEEAVRRADIEYYTFCVRSERARLEWEGAIRNGSTCLRTLEEEKLSLLKDLAVKYYQNLNDFAPKLVVSVESLEEPVKGCSVDQDMHSIVDIRRHVGAEQLLPDFYAEDTSNLMKRDRRYEALQKFIYLINQDLTREKKGAAGVETLAKAIADGPKIVDNSHHDISDKLYYMRSMLLYLEASRCKVDNAIADVEGRQRSNNPITQYMRHQRDKQGLPQTILKVPSWARDDCLAFSTGASSAGSRSPSWHDRGNADGTSGQHDTDFDEFGSEGSGCENIEEFENDSKLINKNLISGPSIGKCRAIYDYDANLFDELTIRVGDEINIHDKQEDGWWLGELNRVIGIFPATYVEEIPTGPSPTSSD